MAYKIVQKEQLSAVSWRLVVEAPRVAARHQAGQFVIVRAHERGERIPLTVADKDAARGTITLFVQAVGKSTRYLCDLPEGALIPDVAGPLGTPTHIEKFGRVACVGGGIGIAALYPIAKALKDAGNEVLSILGAQRADLLILENEMSAVSDKLWVTTDDGSRGQKGLVTGVLEGILSAGGVGLVVAVGPLPMMRAVARMTRGAGILTMVSLNTIMVDGTGMCGGCRVSVGGRKKFACVDGPEFDAHQVDFDELSKRLKSYCEAEKCAVEKYLRKTPESSA